MSYPSGLRHRRPRKQRGPGDHERLADRLGRARNLGREDDPDLGLP